MPLEFFCHPTEIASTLSSDQIDMSIVLLDIFPDLDNDGNVRLELDVLYRAVILRSGGQSMYVASTGGVMIVDATLGRIDRFQPQSVSIATSYKQSVERSQSESVVLHATLGHSEQAQLRSSEKATKGTTSSAEFELKGEEFTLAAQSVSGRQVRWDLRSARVERAITDFVSGNLALTAWMLPEQDQVAGRVRVIPEKVGFFDTSRREIDSRWKRLAFKIKLARAGIRLRNSDGIDLDFRVENKRATL